MAKVLKPAFFLKDEEYSPTGEWDFANVEDSFPALLDGKVETADSNLCVSYRGKSRLYEASSCRVAYEANEDAETQKLVITGKLVVSQKKSSLAIDLPTGEMATMDAETRAIEEVGLKFIPKRYRPR